MRFARHAALIPSLMLAACVATSAAATTYRWVDADGKVHYSDVMPQKQSGMGHVELDKQGRVVKEAPRTRLTPEEVRRREEAAARAEEARRQQEARRRHDLSLLTTYVSEQEIDLARDRALELEALNLKGLKTRLNAAAEKLAYANGQIAGHEKAGREPPRLFAQMREEATEDLARVSLLIGQREKAIEEIKARFAADKARYLELKRGGAVSPR